MNFINGTIKYNHNKIKQYRKLRRKMLIPMIMGKLHMQTSKQINIINITPGNTSIRKLGF